MSAAAAAAAAPDRLSDLSDDLLTHILSFAPIREAASTTALSRRWRRPLWLDTAAVNLDYRSYTTTAGGAILWRAMNDADHAFAFHSSHGCAPKKLTVLMRDDATTHENGILCAPRCITEDNDEEEEEAVSFEEEEYAAAIEEEEEEDDAGVETEEEEDDAGVETEEEEEDAADAGSVEEAEESGSGIQELRVEWLNNGCPCMMLRHALSPCSLPFATLRVLELTGCSLRPHSDGRCVLFPCLEALRLRRCRAALTTLQDMISVAPRLADVRLEAVQFLDGHAVYRLRCPTATAVVMANCGMLVCNCNLYHGGCSVKLSAPRLRRFRYTQAASFNGTSFSLESPTTLTLDHVHLALPASARRLRHSLLSSVRHTSVLTLTAFSLADLNHGYNPMLFTRLERLEIQELSGWCVLDHAAAASGVVDLLSSCPCLRELRLKFRWREYIRETNSDPAEEMAAVADFSPCRSIHDDDVADCCDDLEDELQGRLSHRRRLDCLRRVVVEFDADELTCFQVRLLKFLAKNAGTLEEVVVDGGKGYDSSRIDEKVARWRRKRRPGPLLSPPPPPPLSEFPPLEVPLYLEGEVDAGNPCLDGEVDDGNDTEKLELEVPPCSYGSVIYDEDDDDDTEDEEVEDITPRHFMHSARKKKKGGSPECWSVKPKYKGLITAEWRRGGVGGRRLRRRRPSRGGGGDVVTAGSLPPVPLPATPAPGLPPSLCVFRSLRRAPPPAPWRSLFERRGTPRAPPCRVPLITELLCG